MFPRAKDLEGRDLNYRSHRLPLYTLVNLYVDLRCLRRFAGIYADLLETKNGGDR